MNHVTLYRTMKIDGLSIFYREAGAKDAPTSMPIPGAGFANQINISMPGVSGTVPSTGISRSSRKARPWYFAPTNDQRP